MKPIWILFVALALFLFLGGLQVSPQPPKVCTASGTCFLVVVADTPQAHEKGLMFQGRLDENTGMWFVFEDERPRRFWMKNMRFGLDIVWINKEKEIIGISKNVPPCDEEPCVGYASPGPVQFVLEINAGSADRAGFELGHQVQTISPSTDDV